MKIMPVTKRLMISSLLVSSLSCVQNGHNKPHETKAVDDYSAESDKHKANKSTQSARVIVSTPLSKNAMNVLKAAFETDYSPNQDMVNAYDFPQYYGNKGMDWWNFPWDLPSSKIEYLITYQDMADLLRYTTVRKEKSSTTLVRYSEKLADMVESLTPEIMNAHGGYLRVVKIIYCIRNFLSVAIKHGLNDDIPHLKQAGKKLIATYKTKKLATGSSPYVKGSKFDPKNINGIEEDRTAKNGIAELIVLTK
jgi:hypothetical protein